MMFLTTTAIEIDEELLNRCLVLTRRRGPRADRRRSTALQRDAADARGPAARGRDATRSCALHQNAQRLLRPLAVVNPFARRADLPRRPDAHAARSREVPDADPTPSRCCTSTSGRCKTVSTSGQAIEYIEVTREDIALANRLAHEVLGRTLDELPPQTRRLLDALVALTLRAERAQAGRCSARGALHAARTCATRPAGATRS